MVDTGQYSTYPQAKKKSWKLRLLLGNRKNKYNYTRPWPNQVTVKYLDLYAVIQWKIWQKKKNMKSLQLLEKDL